MRIVVSNVTLVDNGLGIMPFIYAPPSLSHAFADKPVHVQVRKKTTFVLVMSHSVISNLRLIFLLLFLSQNALIVGSSPNFNCLDTLSNSDFNILNSEAHRAPRPLNGKD